MSELIETFALGPVRIDIPNYNKNKTLGSPFKSDLLACITTNPLPNLSYPILKVLDLITQLAHGESSAMVILYPLWCVFSKVLVDG